MQTDLISVARAEFAVWSPVPVNGGYPKGCKSPGAESPHCQHTVTPLPQREPANPDGTAIHSPNLQREPQEFPITTNTSLLFPDAAHYKPFKPSLVANEVGQDPQVPQETAGTSPVQECRGTNSGSRVDVFDLNKRTSALSDGAVLLPRPVAGSCPAKGTAPRLQSLKVKPTKSGLSVASQLHRSSEQHLPPAAPAPTCARSRGSADASAVLGSASAVINVHVKRQLKPPQPLPDTAPSCLWCYLQLC